VVLSSPLPMRACPPSMRMSMCFDLDLYLNDAK
jgi:hypothetical protein